MRRIVKDGYGLSQSRQDGQIWRPVEQDGSKRDKLPQGGQWAAGLDAGAETERPAPLISKAGTGAGQTGRLPEWADRQIVALETKPAYCPAAVQHPARIGYGHIERHVSPGLAEPNGSQVADRITTARRARKTGVGALPEVDEAEVAGAGRQLPSEGCGAARAGQPKGATGVGALPAETQRSRESGPRGPGWLTILGMDLTPRRRYRSYIARLERIIRLRSDEDNYLRAQLDRADRRIDHLCAYVRELEQTNDRLNDEVIRLQAARFRLRGADGRFVRRERVAVPACTLQTGREPGGTGN